MINKNSNKQQKNNKNNKESDLEKTDATLERYQQKDDAFERKTEQTKK